LAEIYKRVGRKEDAQAELQLFERLNKKAQALKNPLLPKIAPEEQE
jgi:hypothetical protein